MIHPGCVNWERKNTEAQKLLLKYVILIFKSAVNFPCGKIFKHILGIYVYASNGYGLSKQREHIYSNPNYCSTRYERQVYQKANNVGNIWSYGGFLRKGKKEVISLKTGFLNSNINFRTRLYIKNRWLLKLSSERIWLKILLLAVFFRGEGASRNH